MWFKEPENSESTTVSVEAQSFDVVNGYVEVPDHFAPQMINHGFTPSTPPASATPPEDETSADTLVPIDSMNRKQLFAYLNGAGAPATLPITNSELRERAHAVAAEAKAKGEAAAAADADGEDDLNKTE